MMSDYIAASCALLAMLISAAVFGGWIWDMPELKTVLPGWVSMKPLTATACFFSGAALWLLNPRRESALRRRWGQGCALLPALIGGLTLCAYLTGWDFHIDRVLFPQSVAQEGGMYPGRPAPSTAFCLLMLGMALMAASYKADRPTIVLALCAHLAALLALLGYAYDAAALYRLYPYTSIAPHTTVALLLLSFGVLSECPSICINWLGRNLAGSLVVRWLLPTALMLPVAVGWLQLQGQRAGYYDEGFGAALFATFHSIAFSGLICWIAHLLNRADAAREASHAAVRDSEERFRLLVDASPNGVLMTDPAGNIQLANRQAERLFGYAPGQLRGRDAITLLKGHALDKRAEGVATFALALHAGAKSGGHEHIGVRQDGSEFIAQVELNPLDAGNMMLITLADITERKAAEKERDRFVALADASVEFIGMCNRNFEPFYVNAAGMRMVGLTSLAEALATNVQDYFFPEDQDFVTRQFFPQVVREGSCEVEIRFRHFKTGEAIWMLYNVFNLHDDDGNIIGWATVSRNINDRKRLEARFRAAIESAPSAMVMTDEQGLIVLVNTRTEELFGYDRREMLGRNVECLIPERFRERHQPQRHAYARAPVSRPMGRGRELFGLRNDGSEFPVEIGLNPVNIDEGTFVLAAIVDITERRRAEAAYRESEERLRLLVEGVQDYAIIMLDTEGRVASWNIGAKRITGYEAGDIMGRHFSCFYSAEDIASDKPSREIAAAIEDGRYQEDGVRVRKDGSQYWANVVLTALRDADGKLRGFAKVTRDITDKKQAEEKILQINSKLEQRVAMRTQELEAANVRLQNELIERQRAEDEIERFFKMSVDMICIIGAEGYFYRVNPSFETTLGYSRAELTSRPILDFVHPEDLAATREEMAHLAAGMSNVHFENRCLCKDGSYKWLGWTAQPAPDGTFYAIARDITARKRYEAQIAASLHEKEVLLQEIHHRVKNNLQVIASLLRLQADALNDPVARELFFESQRRVRSMALVHEQLYQSSGLANIKMSEYIVSLVNYIRRSYNHTWSVVTVKTEISDISLDIERAVPLGLVVSELTANCFKHAFKSLPADQTGELWIKLVDAGGDELLLEVGDNGGGIPDDVDIDRPSSMGLHLVHSFVMQLHGRLTVCRSPHTLFSITLPKKK